MAINSITAAKANGMTATAAATSWWLDYAAMYPDTTKGYEESQMILRIHSYASNQSETEFRSCAGVNFFLGSPNYNNTK